MASFFNLMVKYDSNYNIEVVKNCVYLGSEDISNNGITVEVKKRIVPVKQCFFSLNHLAFRKAEIKLYSEVVVLVLLYGSQIRCFLTLKDN